MRMSHDDLVLLLAETLNAEQEKAEEFLSAWIQSVKTEALEKGEYHVPGLGTFKEADGKLVFSPEDELAVEVNYKYAGMKPIEIMSAFSSRQIQEEDHKQPEEVEPVSPQKKGLDAEVEEPGTEEEELETGKKDESGKSFEDVFGVDSSEETTPETPDPVPPPLAYQTPETEPVGVSGSGRKETAEKKEMTATAGKPPKSGKKPASGENQSRVWMLPIAAAFILAVMLYFHFEGHLLHRQYTEEAMVSDTRSEAPGETGIGSEPMEHRIEATPEEEAEAEELPYGLMGAEEELLIGSYTIVLHSIANENRARIEMENLIDEGYKATFWQAQLGNGEHTWRVGVGQFETVSDAENAISRLPEPYRSNNFIIRIR